MKTHVGMIVLVGAFTISGCKPADTDTNVPGQTKTIEETTEDGRRVVMQVKINEAGEEVRHGTFTAYYKNGNKWGEEEYKDGLRHGKFAEWHSTGVKKKEGQFVDDQQDGVWTVWDRNGNQVDQFEFDKGTPLATEPATEPATTAPAPTTAPAAAPKPSPTTQPASP